jgi:hypothetical protein
MRYFCTFFHHVAAFVAYFERYAVCVDFSKGHVQAYRAVWNGIVYGISVGFVGIAVNGGARCRADVRSRGESAAFRFVQSKACKAVF